MNKTVIFVWTTNVINLETTDRQHFWGIGDILRGMISTCIICKKYKYDFIIDIQKHPISKYLKPIEHNYIKDVKYCNNIPFIMGNEVESYIKNNKNNLIMLMTNKTFNMNEIDNEIKLKIKNILVKNELFESYYVNIKKEINLKNNYNIIHFRTGDNFLVLNNNINENYLENLFKIYFKNKTSNDLLISDNTNLKKYIKKKDNDVYIFNINNISHIGFKKHENYYKDTLVEFFLITESKSIKTYSIYDWTSGFVLYPSILYDIILKDLNI